ncbi:Alpha/Beta hydrolase protein [Dactylonectria estremocensis]|uniref:Alpha/Beta hydrolase protein n=1 Tax=Dactylonectria estremocensis TaxID=1079267 RepID=A0A9P9FFT5_9HYPO|nr:Alpha/Beta hydrolase protein [Dactylonectria estremocensis]
MNSFPLDRFHGYMSKTFTFKSTPESSISVDVIYPEETNSSPSTVLMHYHGGFLIVGDRYTFLPYWLVHACVSRKWIFVTPDYRLMPETTAHSAIQDAKDAYAWVRSSLSGLLGRSIGAVHMAGSSAGGYLAMSTAMTAVEIPDSLLLIYGMLDPAGVRYTTPGSNIFGRSVIDTRPVFREFPNGIKKADNKVISAYPLLGDPAQDHRLALVSALHIEARFPDYMTGMVGLSGAIVEDGLKAVPEEHRVLFPCSFGGFAKFPRTMLLHGLNDSAVPVENSFRAAEKLREAGVLVTTEFPEDAEHGFDARAGNVDVEGDEGSSVVAVESLRRAIDFLDSSGAKSQ